jgi:hypothetical protein
VIPGVVKGATWVAVANCKEAIPVTESGVKVAFWRQRCVSKIGQRFELVHGSQRSVDHGVAKGGTWVVVANCEEAIPVTESGVKVAFWRQRCVSKIRQRFELFHGSQRSGIHGVAKGATWVAVANFEEAIPVTESGAMVAFWRQRCVSKIRQRFELIHGSKRSVDHGVAKGVTWVVVAKCEEAIPVTESGAMVAFWRQRCVSKIRQRLELFHGSQRSVVHGVANGAIWVDVADFEEAIPVTGSGAKVAFWRQMGVSKIGQRFELFQGSQVDARAMAGCEEATPVTSVDGGRLVIARTMVCCEEATPVTSVDGGRPVVSGTLEACCGEATPVAPVVGDRPVIAGTIEACCGEATPVAPVVGNRPVTAGSLEACCGEATPVAPVVGNRPVTAGTLEACCGEATPVAPVVGNRPVAAGTLEACCGEATPVVPVIGNRPVAAGTLLVLVVVVDDDDDRGGGWVRTGVLTNTNPVAGVCV